MRDVPSFQAPARQAASEELQKVYLVFQYRGPVYTSVPETSAERAVVDAHRAYVSSLYERGAAIAIGPVLGGSEPADLVALSVLRAQTAGEAERIAADDPAVKAGRFRVVVRPWLLPAGL